jgi:hypothetical protein
VPEFKKFVVHGYFMGCYELFIKGEKNCIGDIQIALESLEEDSTALYIESVRNLTIENAEGTQKRLSHVGLALLEHACEIATEYKKQTIEILPTKTSLLFWQACGFQKKNHDQKNMPALFIKTTELLSYIEKTVDAKDNVINVNRPKM